MTTLERMPIKPVEEYGPVLAGRGQATGLRERVEAELVQHGRVVIDFAGVESMSPSFADELFAKLPLLADDSILFENLPEDLEALRQYVMRGRHGPG